MHIKSWACLAALGLASLSQQAFAGSIVGSMSEPFNYDPGTLFPNTGGTPNGGTGWNLTGDFNQANTAGWGTGTQNNGAAAGTNRTATSPGLSYTATGYANGTGNKLTLDSVTPNSSESQSRSLGGQTIDTGTTYFSVLMRKDNDTLRTMNMAFFSLVGTASSEQLTVGQIGAAVGGVLTGSNGKIAVIYKNMNPAGIKPSTVDMGVGVTHLVIGRIDWNTDVGGTLETVTAWVDPTDVTTEAAAVSAKFYTGTEFDLTNISFVRPFTGNTAATTPPTNPVQGDYDEIRVGGTWDSVMNPVVPEPASFALIGLGSLGLLARRRNQD